MESKQKVSNFSGSTGSERLMMMEALQQLSLGFLDIATEKQFFQKQKSLKDSGYRIAADLPKEIVNRRKLQSKKLVDARKAGKIAFFSRAEPDKLYIDGHLNQL